MYGQGLYCADIGTANLNTTMKQIINAEEGAPQKKEVDELLKKANNHTGERLQYTPTKYRD